MARRDKDPIDFSSIDYTTANEDKRWHLDVGDSNFLSLSSSQKATIINNLFKAGSSPAINSQPFGKTGGITVTEVHGKVTIAVRLPQTTRLLDTIFNRASGTDSDDLFTAKGMKYTVEVSGRSDKKYSEIIDWVKVCDNTEQVADLATDSSAVYLPEADGTYVLGNDADRFHARMFPYYTSWVRITFENIRTVYDTGTITPDLHLERVDLHSFIEDTTSAEGAPTAEMVFPLAGTPWLPSQTVYFTSRIYEPDTDAVHVRFEIYKETGGDSQALDSDTLMYTLESNALNLDGTHNENYSHSWIGLPIQDASYTTPIYLPGYVEEIAGGGNYPNSVLIVPTEAAGGPGTAVTLDNVRFYDNQGNILKFDTTLDYTWDHDSNAGTAEVPRQTFSPINVPTEAGKANAQGWVINFGTNVKFNRIDFVNPATGNAPTKVEVYYNSNTVSYTEDTLVAGEWDNTNSNDNFRGKDFTSNIEFCWPDVGSINNFDPSVEQIEGYKEGTLGAGGEVADDPDSYNPDRNGIGITETNAGDWTKIHPFAGVMVGPSYSAVNSGVSKTHSTELGDSPVPTEASTKGNATILTTGTGIDIGTGTPSKAVAERIMYVRLAMLDPYLDGDRFYARCYVWDGRTEIV